MHLRRNRVHLDLFIDDLIVKWLERYGKTALKPPPRRAGVNAPVLRAEAKRLTAAKASQMKMHAAGRIKDADLETGLAEIYDRLAVIGAQLAVQRSARPARRISRGARPCRVAVTVARA